MAVIADDLAAPAARRFSLLTAIRRNPTIAFGGVLLVLLIMDGPRSKTAGFHSGVSPWVYLVDQAPLIVHYLRLVVWPVGLVFDYGETTVQALGEVWVDI